MDFLEELIHRNAAFAEEGFSADLKIMPSRKTMILGCVDPRGDPGEVLDLEPGEAVVIRNVGGRVDPAVLRTMRLLRSVVRTRGSDVGLGWHFIVLHHTDCGIIDCAHKAPDLLTQQLGISMEKLGDAAFNDPYMSVALDVTAMKANPNFPGNLAVSGLVYDVATGRSEVVVPETLLRS